MDLNSSVTGCAVCQHPRILAKGLCQRCYEKQPFAKRRKRKYETSEKGIVTQMTYNLNKKQALLSYVVSYEVSTDETAVALMELLNGRPQQDSQLSIESKHIVLWFNK